MSLKGDYIPYSEARNIIRSLKIKQVRDWNKYCKTGKSRRIKIPTHPHITYKNKGWVSWMEWLGTNNKEGGNRRHKINDDYFKKWSPNMAYILGFWFADGHIGNYHNSYIFSIAQHEDDKYILESILKEMGCDNILTKAINCCHFVITSETIYNDIIGLGGKERKSLDVKFPKIPKKYLPDFIRGLWDGDGSIFYNKQSKSYSSSYASGSKYFIEELHRVLRRNISNLGGGLNKNTNGVYHLVFARNDTVRLKRFLYQELSKDKLTLKRKYDLFLKTSDYCSREFLDYKDAQKDAQKMIKLLGIKSKREWFKFCRKSGLRPHNIPYNPYLFYKNSGWIDWYDWLGKSRKPKIISLA